MTETKMRRLRASDYEALMAEHSTSGMTLRAFAESKDIKPMTFYAWHRRLRPKAGRSAQTAAHEIVPVRIADREDLTQPDGSAPIRSSFDLTLSGDRVVTVHPGFDAAELRRFLAVLESR